MSVTLKVYEVTIYESYTTLLVIMVLRRSRLLQQLEPEETNLDGCLICQDDFFH